MIGEQARSNHLKSLCAEFITLQESSPAQYQDLVTPPSPPALQSPKRAPGAPRWRREEAQPKGSNAQELL